MRFLFRGALCLVTFSVHANVIQYFAGISYNNPAELFKTKKYQFILGNVGSYADLKFAGSVLNFNTFHYDTGINNSRTITLMPYGRAAKRLDKKTVFAVDVTEPFNSNLNWRDHTFTRFAVTQNYLTDVDVSPKLGYSLTKKLQVGGGVNFNFLIHNEINWAYPISPTTSAILNNQTSSFGIGYNLGFTYLFDKKNFLGLTYYSRIRQNTQGTSTFSIYTNPNLSFSFYMPATTILSYTHVFNKEWLFNVQGFLSEWNANQYVRLLNTAVPPPNQDFSFEMSFSKSTALLLALRNQFNKKLGLTLIGMKDDGPEKNHLRNLVFPSAIQYVIGLSADYHVNKCTTLEVLYGHVFSWPRIQNSVLINNVIQPFSFGTVNINAEVLDLRIRWDFDKVQPPSKKSSKSKPSQLTRPILKGAE